MTGRDVASALLEAVLNRPRGTSIEEAIDAFARRIGIVLTNQKRNELVRAIAQHNN